MSREGCLLRTGVHAAAMQVVLTAGNVPCTILTPGCCYRAGGPRRAGPGACRPVNDTLSPRTLAGGFFCITQAQAVRQGCVAVGQRHCRHTQHVGQSGISRKPILLPCWGARGNAASACMGCSISPFLLTMHHGAHAVGCKVNISHNYADKPNAITALKLCHAHATQHPTLCTPVLHAPTHHMQRQRWTPQCCWCPPGRPCRSAHPCRCWHHTCTRQRQASGPQGTLRRWKGGPQGSTDQAVRGVD
jgi:hypothetical protein